MFKEVQKVQEGSVKIKEGLRRFKKVHKYSRMSKEKGFQKFQRDIDIN